MAGQSNERGHIQSLQLVAPTPTAPSNFPIRNSSHGGQSEGYSLPFAGPSPQFRLIANPSFAGAAFARAREANPGDKTNDAAPIA